MVQTGLQEFPQSPANALREFIPDLKGWRIPAPLRCRIPTPRSRAGRCALTSRVPPGGLWIRGACASDRASAAKFTPLDHFTHLTRLTGRQA